MGLLHNLQIAVIYCSYLIIPYYVFVFTYRLTFHPLKNYPGPLIAKLTNAYGGFHAVLKRSHLATHENHVNYGSVVRHGPNRLVFNTVTALQDIYNNPLMIKSHVYTLGRLLPITNVFDTLDVDEHRRKRKIISQPISEKAMRAFGPVMAEQVHTYAQQLLAACRRSETVNMTKRFEHLGGDVVGQLGFGYSLKMQTEETNQWLIWALTFFGKRINIYMQFPRVAYIEPLLRLLGRSIREKYRSIVEKMIRNRVALPKDAKFDLYAFAVDSMGGGTSIRDNELWAEAFFFIVAGGTTTATSMSALCFYLSRYPECYQKLTEEIRSNFKSGQEIRSGQQLQGCSYLRACINEALRMSPPVPGFLWREQVLASNAQLIVDGHLIPRGTEVAVNFYALHHNENYFPEPFTFKPERWLTPEADDSSSLMRKAFAPFSVGSRACAGKAVAYLEISLALASTLYYFDFEFAPGKPGQLGGGTKGRRDDRGREDEFQLYEAFGAFHDGPLLMFKERKGFCDELGLD